MAIWLVEKWRRTVSNLSGMWIKTVPGSLARLASWVGLRKLVAGTP